MKRLTALTCIAASAACSQPDAQSDTADDFAARVGTSGLPAENVGAPVETEAYTAPAVPNTDVKQLEQLGDIGNINLGPRAGGCAFSSGGSTMLAAAGPRDRGLPGKATVRVDGQLLVLDAPPGGYDAVRAGTTFNGEGFSVLVTAGEDNAATMTITDAAGEQRAFDGRWVCS